MPELTALTESGSPPKEEPTQDPVHESAEAPAPGSASNDTQAEEEESDWGINSIRGSFEAVNSYFDSMLELLGGRDGEKLLFLVLIIKFQSPMAAAPTSWDYLYLRECVDMGIPAMTKCCNQLDLCYDTCGSNKYRCDSKFRWCLHGICSDLKKSLGFVSRVEVKGIFLAYPEPMPSPDPTLNQCPVT
ncbi:hypothetical protein JZ751_010647 [Albula glossodonta]|uniref:Group XIIB secretory phospholipase A2-like protein n=1 Tax=Albula glossodonta TaxID=121402 RepID=A0A8T2N0V7_9TELE|nr:hypothetical protein JZ751_010647 [Albula glossodonta]